MDQVFTGGPAVYVLIPLSLLVLALTARIIYLARPRPISTKRLFSGVNLELSRAQIRDALLSADLGAEFTATLLSELPDSEDPVTLKAHLRAALLSLIGPNTLPEISITPHVILMVGVNGVGKTTTTAKLAKHYQSRGKKVLLAAADVFRAAAVEQLKTWADRLDLPIVTIPQTKDPAAVTFQAIKKASDEHFDVVIIDTAGRLHNKTELMDELSKMARVSEKILQRQPDRVILVLDGTTGQNALNQARAFKEVAPISEIIITKLDGTSKGGVALAIKKESPFPIAFVGTGEGIDDLSEFSADAFLKRILG